MGEGASDLDRHPDEAVMLIEAEDLFGKGEDGDNGGGDSELKGSREGSIRAGGRVAYELDEALGLQNHVVPIGGFASSYVGGTRHLHGEIPERGDSCQLGNCIEHGNLSKSDIPCGERSLSQMKARGAPFGASGAIQGAAKLTLKGRKHGREGYVLPVT